ncbi:hypothetical protein GGR57DRAFT_458685 [Xylariaceae sp. FL1272]|nr:hypothetical protein GGR57DRAFT_458685 [Xylariaceae sp. FL1272]
MLSKLLLTASVLGAVSAQVPALLQRGHLERRQDDLDPGCSSVLNDIATIYADAPTPPADLATVTITDPCSVPTFTGKLASEYSSYVTAAESWYTEHSKELSSIVEACTQYATATEAIPDCSATSGVTSAATSTSGSAAATTTGATSSGSGSASSTSATGSDSTPSATTGGASRETGFVAAAALAVGIAVAIL